MSAIPPPPAIPRPGHHPAWLLALAALLVYQGWMTLGLFGPAPPAECWRRLLDDEPIRTGRHPLHLYHGYLGADSMVDRGQMCCFDPAFHAGYPKTPVFDSGSRPAELALLLVGAEYRPAAYKLGVAALVLAVPLWVYLGARGLGLSRAVAVMAAGLAQIVWWGQSGREALMAGDVDLVLASLMLLAQAGLLARYHKRPGPGLIGVVLTCGVGWFAHPLLMLLTLPAFLIYYVSAGTRHRLAWHAPLIGGLVAAIAVNGLWLYDWVLFWWLRVPPGLDTPLVEAPGPAALWGVPLWGDTADKSLACALLGVAVVGLVLLNRQSGQRPAARLLALCAPGLAALAVAAAVWEPLGRLGMCQLMLPALWFACLPAALALARGLGALRHWGGVSSPAVVCVSAPVLLWLAAGPVAVSWAERYTHPAPLELGLGEDGHAIVEVLLTGTDDSARILWEDRACDRKGSRWPALLPLLTGRAFLGGLDAGAGIEHSTGGLRDGQLAGRPLAEWSDDELASYCRRYNVGWVVCWSPEARQRFGRWAPTGKARAMPDAGALFLVQRPRSYIIQGQARWGFADTRGILLADVVPAPVPGEKEGQVLLSLHYQAGMRVRPDRVRIEPAYDPQDAIPFVRLRMKEPVGRVFITWEGR